MTGMAFGWSGATTALACRTILAAIDSRLRFSEPWRRRPSYCGRSLSRRENDRTPLDAGDDKQLIALRAEGLKWHVVAKKLGRTEAATVSRAGVETVIPSPLTSEPAGSSEAYASSDLASATDDSVLIAAAFIR